jgi:hypothetical protein
MQPHLFDIVSRPVGDFSGKTARHACIKCRVLGCVEVAYIKANPFAKGASSDGKENRSLTRKFEGLNWRVGSTRNSHLCPEHRKEQQLRVEASNNKHKATNGVGNMQQYPRVVVGSPPPQAAPHQSQPSPKPPLTGPSVLPASPPVGADIDREDKRRILNALEGAWDFGSESYGRGHSDKSIAENLKVPQAWVAYWRNNIYGAINTNPEIDELHKKADALSAELKKFEERYAIVLKTYADEGRKLKESADELTRRVLEMRNALR